MNRKIRTEGSDIKGLIGEKISDVRLMVGGRLFFYEENRLAFIRY